eukprot:TRINITY_DN36934_c0_g1_i2.p1 TRINITY_DN36934_c0_g1~~TRINITY_DN36934_c0_g1_i2.p1  ORF type:complete len:172 (-),score=46.34 TRINITY_DN36934_c0_g1_i2:672-1187(-)
MARSGSSSVAASSAGKDAPLFAHFMRLRIQALKATRGAGWRPGDATSAVLQEPSKTVEPSGLRDSEKQVLLADGPSAPPAKSAYDSWIDVFTDLVDKDRAPTELQADLHMELEAPCSGPASPPGAAAAAERREGAQDEVLQEPSNGAKLEPTEEDASDSDIDVLPAGHGQF